MYYNSEGFNTIVSHGKMDTSQLHLQPPQSIK